MKNLLFCIILLLGVKVQAQNEKLEYVLRYGFIRGGKVLLQTTDTTYKTKESVHHYMRARTSGIADKLYRVDDIYESIIDKKSERPLKTIRNVREGKYRYYNEIEFENQSDTIVSQKSGKMAAPENMVDILGLYFYLRNPEFIEKLKEEKTIEMPVNNDEDIFTMRVNYLGEEIIKTDFGKKECIVIAPVVKKGKVLTKDDGLKFYITNNEQHIPIYMEFDMKVGAVKCELQNYYINGINQTIQ